MKKSDLNEKNTDFCGVEKPTLLFYGNCEKTKDMVSKVVLDTNNCEEYEQTEIYCVIDFDEETSKEAFDEMFSEIHKVNENDRKITIFAVSKFHISTEQWEEVDALLVKNELIWKVIFFDDLFEKNYKFYLSFTDMPDEI